MAMQETRKNVFLAKSGALPAVANVVALNVPVIISPKIATGKTDGIGTGALANAKGYVDSDNVTAEFRVETNFRSPVSLGVACELSELLKMCGLAETLTAATSAVYKLGGITSSGTGQIKTHLDGMSRTVTGISANVKISGKIGEPLKATFDVKGVTSVAATAVANPTVTLNKGEQIIMKKSTTTFTVGGATLAASEFELDIGAEVERSYSSNTNEYYIKNFTPKLTVTAVKTKTTDEEAWTQLANGRGIGVTLNIGAEANKFRLIATNAFGESVEESDDRDRIAIKRTLLLQSDDTANNNFTIILM